MLVRREDFHRFAGVLCRLLGNWIRLLFLNAAASSGVADFGFFGRGFWIDQPIAFSAYLAFAAPDIPLSRNASLCPGTRLSTRPPRCGATEMRPSSAAIQSATLRLDHSPPSGGGSRGRPRNFVKSSGFRIVADAPLRRRKSSLRSLGIVTGEQLFDTSLAKGRRRRHLRDGVTTRRQPNPLEMARCGGILTSNVTRFQLLHAQMPADCRHVSPRIMALKLICFARPRESLLQRRVNQPKPVSDLCDPLARAGDLRLEMERFCWAGVCE
jgi:hypothetical protein